MLDQRHAPLCKDKLQSWSFMACSAVVPSLFSVKIVISLDYDKIHSVIIPHWSFFNLKSFLWRFVAIYDFLNVFITANRLILVANTHLKWHMILVWYLMFSKLKANYMFVYLLTLSRTCNVVSRWPVAVAGFIAIVFAMLMSCRSSSTSSMSGYSSKHNPTPRPSEGDVSVVYETKANAVDP